MTAPAGIECINIITKIIVHFPLLPVVPLKAMAPPCLNAYDNQPNKHEICGYGDMGYVAHIMNRKTTGLKQTVCPHFM